MPRPRKTRGSLPAHVHAVKARGREYFYFQPHRGTRYVAKRVPLSGLPYKIDGTPNEEWWTAYRVASGTIEKAPATGTFSALKQAYLASPEWKDIGKRTKENWLRDLSRIEAAWGNLPVVGLEPKHVLKLRDQHAATPAAANNLIKCLSALMTWSIPRGWRSTNPCAHIKKLKIGDGYPPWDWDDIDYFKANAPPHLWHAAALALYTGQRLLRCAGRM